MITQKKITLAGAGICCLLLLTLGTGCRAKTLTVPVTIVATVSVTPTSTAKTAVSTVPTTTPKLNTASISLTIMPPSDYVANVLPLYLTGDTVLHMSWMVVGGPFRMTVTTPGGQVVPVSSDGVQTSGTAGPLAYSGGIVFCISDAAYSGLGWGEGYYNFTPNLIQGDAPVKITLNYYFDTQEDTSAMPATSATNTVSTTPTTSISTTTPAVTTSSATSTAPATH